MIENILQGNKIKHAIIGIGLNVNQENFPANLKNVTSLKQALHQDYNLMQILGEICAVIEARYLQLKAGNIVRIRDEYLAKLYLKDEIAVFRFNNEIQTAVIRDITASGQLVLETSSGLQYFNNKEIEFIN